VRAGDLAAHGLAALDAAPVEVREAVPVSTVEAAARSMPRTPRLPLETRAAVAEIRRRLECAAREREARAELVEVTAIIERAHASLIAVQQAIAEATAR
jgi:hypothetical protein